MWCAAEPCGFVTDTAFEHISEMILTGIADAGPLDGIYLDLHGAMVTESFDDAESELLRRVRAALDCLDHDAAKSLSSPPSLIP